jgi:hypothetical protein
MVLINGEVKGCFTKHSEHCYEIGGTERTRTFPSLEKALEWLLNEQYTQQTLNIR